MGIFDTPHRRLKQYDDVKVEVDGNHEPLSNSNFSNDFGASGVPYRCLHQHCYKEYASLNGLSLHIQKAHSYEQNSGNGPAR